ncbi:hypothetical protein [Bacteroides sp.]
MFCSEGYFPASGYRISVDGSLNNIGKEGDIRSSSALGSTSAFGGYFFFSGTYVMPLYGSRRTYAFTVRCVQAFIKVS